MLKKIIERLKSVTFSKTAENRIRRVVELTTLIAGALLILVGLIKILFFQGTLTDNLIELTVGLVATQIAYRGLVEDLPRPGAMVSKRRFWE